MIWWEIERDDFIVYFHPQTVEVRRYTEVLKPKNSKKHLKARKVPKFTGWNSGQVIRSLKNNFEEVSTEDIKIGDNLYSTVIIARNMVT